MVTDLLFLGKVFWDFEKWTKKMSKNEIPKKLCPKNCRKTALPCLQKYKRFINILNYTCIK